ncbi:MAG TPA: hypothetical protein VD997_02725 [Phycisphaerales bacterium]|nr:hypothetical protein [Phycisphaerales bacterium]
MYDVLPSFILGFHGCDRTVAEQVFAGAASLKPSVNDFDWLGHGVYFWENNPARAMEYAAHLSAHPRKVGPRIKDPAVVGAVIDLGRCLNLLDHTMIELVRMGYTRLSKLSEQANVPLPQNVGGSDLLRRYLDCAVVEEVHSTPGVEPFDTVRGVFVEGAPIYPGAGFHEKSHIQVCVREASCIKGYFRVMPEALPHS